MDGFVFIYEISLFIAKESQTGCDSKWGLEDRVRTTPQSVKHLLGISEALGWIPTTSLSHKELLEKVKHKIIVPDLLANCRQGPK